MANLKHLNLILKNFPRREFLRLNLMTAPCFYKPYEWPDDFINSHK